ncbi:hypothetical protein [Bradyrhizobium sp. USDA 4545]|uniref:hypothetical protein n=1 Tax=Bradyrhizobium sp. USDA 4545 TaxID=2817705 RepID=UPI0020A2CB71|nr:hypothetical protein [Bradyrhizobium sp. USDA 4545]MCP1832857.1 hypothetical protein [Bradyrhizobium sp. USDA 4545]
MMTIKQILSTGHEMVIQANSVSYQPMATAGPNPAPQALFVDCEDGELRTFASGTYFVMNDSGSTVARYYLGEEPDQIPSNPSLLRTIGGHLSPTEDQIKHMVNRFLGWKLPENFNPDGGVSFKKTFNEHTAHPGKHEPSGTNLLDAEQATAMVRHIIEGMPPVV